MLIFRPTVLSRLDQQHLRTHWSYSLGRTVQEHQLLVSSWHLRLSRWDWPCSCRWKCYTGHRRTGKKRPHPARPMLTSTYTFQGWIFSIIDRSTHDSESLPDKIVWSRRARPPWSCLAEQALNLTLTTLTPTARRQTHASSTPMASMLRRMARFLPKPLFRAI